ncbi:MAG: TerD family protein [Enterococcus sp.]|nr:TerD family protein [Enterococcus sp.]
MALTLSKGQNLSLTKNDPGLTRITVGLGWDARSTDGQEFDLDASALLLNSDRKVRSEADFVFYNQMGDVTLPNSGGVPQFDPERASVMYQGDNRTGEGDGDDEQIVVDLTKVPNDVESIVFTVSIYDFEARRQQFGQVRNAFIRLENEITKQEIVRYDLTEDYSTETALIFAELYRYNGEWKFRAVGQGFNDGLAGIIRTFGLNL